MNDYLIGNRFLKRKLKEKGDNNNNPTENVR